jgi:two-component system response regulator HupR/HoxA
MSQLPTVLVVDDEVRSQETLRRILEEEFEVLTASSGDEALEILGREWIQVMLCDQRMPGMTGVELLQQVRSNWPDVVRIIVSGYTETEDIIAGVNEAGIYQYITKPYQPESLLLSVRSAAELHRLQMENSQLSLELRTATPVLREQVRAGRKQLRDTYHFDFLVKSPHSPLVEICATAKRISQFDIPIMVTGESGTGKELMARAIHYASPRAEKSFVIENCGALSDQLLESELFGHKRGAYTGAFEDRVGLFEQADGGTIFLDEIGETSPALQVKLLRVLQEGEIRPLGSSRSRKVDVRVIAATNRDLEEDVRSGRFREDLYYRIATFTLHIPPLRDRPMDVPLIAKDLLLRASNELHKSVDGLTPEAVASLCRYPWPGNVRELQNEIYRALALTDDQMIGAELLSSRVLQSVPADTSQLQEALPATEGTLKERVEIMEQRILRETLIRNRWNKTKAAQELGISRVGLRSKLQRYGLEKV